MSVKWWCTPCQKWVELKDRESTVKQCGECMSGRVRPPQPSEMEEARL